MNEKKCVTVNYRRWLVGGTQKAEKVKKKIRNSLDEVSLPCLTSLLHYFPPFAPDSFVTTFQSELKVSRTVEWNKFPPPGQLDIKKKHGSQKKSKIVLSCQVESHVTVCWRNSHGAHAHSYSFNLIFFFFLLLFIYIFLVSISKTWILNFSSLSWFSLHGGMFDQLNGILSTTRVLDRRYTGHIGHFLVAIRQWEPPTVKTNIAEKRKGNKVFYGKLNRDESKLYYVVKN